MKLPSSPCQQAYACLLFFFGLLGSLRAAVDDPSGVPFVDTERLIRNLYAEQPNMVAVKKILASYTDDYRANPFLKEVRKLDASRSVAPGTSVEKGGAQAGAAGPIFTAAGFTAEFSAIMIKRFKEEVEIEKWRLLVEFMERVDDSRNYDRPLTALLPRTMAFIRSSHDIAMDISSVGTVREKLQLDLQEAPANLDGFFGGLRLPPRQRYLLDVAVTGAIGIGNNGKSPYNIVESVRSESVKRLSLAPADPVVQKTQRALTAITLVSRLLTTDRTRSWATSTQIENLLSHPETDRGADALFVLLGFTYAQDKEPFNELGITNELGIVPRFLEEFKSATKTVTLLRALRTQFEAVQADAAAISPSTAQNTLASATAIARDLASLVTTFAQLATELGFAEALQPEVIQTDINAMLTQLQQISNLVDRVSAGGSGTSANELRSALDTLKADVAALRTTANQLVALVGSPLNLPALRFGVGTLAADLRRVQGDIRTVQSLGTVLAAGANVAIPTEVTQLGQQLDVLAGRLGGIADDASRVLALVVTIKDVVGAAQKNDVPGVISGLIELVPVIFPADLEVNPLTGRLGPKLDTVAHFIMEHGRVLAALCAAKPEEAQAALDAFWMPAGSWSQKQSVASSVTLNSYFGVSGGWETLRGDLAPGVKRSQPRVGFTAPIGIAFNQGRANYEILGVKVGATSWFFPVVDIGAAASWRLGGGNDGGQLSSLEWSNIIAPGAYYVMTTKNHPFSLMIGAQYGPMLRKVKTGTGLEIERAAWQVPNIGLTFDIPIYNLHVGSRKAK